MESSYEEQLAHGTNHMIINMCIKQNANRNKGEKVMKNMKAKLATAILAGSMVVSSMGMMAMADEAPATELTINKTITKEDTTYAPVETFHFNVTNGKANSFNGETVYAGVEGGLKAGVIEFKGTSTEGTGDSKLTVNASAFTKPGVYHYVLSEKEGTNNMMTYDKTEYDVYVYIYADKDTAPQVVAVEKGAETAKDKVTSLDFTNEYDKTTDRTHDVTVTKTITGNQSVKTNKYEFEYKVLSESDNELKYTAEVNGTVVDGGIEKNKVYTATLTDKGTIKIYGLTENDTVEIYEVDSAANQDGYTTTVKDADGVTANDKKTGVAGAVTKDGAKATVDNNKNTTTPTGIVMTYAPYILMAALACVLGFVLLGRRNREEI